MRTHVTRSRRRVTGWDALKRPAVAASRPWRRLLCRLAVWGRFPPPWHTLGQLPPGQFPLRFSGAGGQPTFSTRALPQPGCPRAPIGGLQAESPVPGETSCRSPGLPG